MKNLWSESEADQFVDQYGGKWGADLALRTYTTRLLGREESLVLHGGGNTSVKGIHRDVLGRDIPALFMKASGFDLGTITVEGAPAAIVREKRCPTEGSERKDS